MKQNELIKKLNLLPHPEGGYYAETYRSAEMVRLEDGRQRNTCTAIFFLLADNDRSLLHRIRSDELWFFHQGEALEIVYIQDGSIHKLTLGTEIDKGEILQAMIPANTWFGSRLKNSSGYALVSCTVAPGFDFKDFELAERGSLVKEFPHLKEAIVAYT